MLIQIAKTCLGNGLIFMIQTGTNRKKWKEEKEREKRRSKFRVESADTHLYSSFHSCFHSIHSLL